jgi:hypothetical protein
MALDTLDLRILKTLALTPLHGLRHRPAHRASVGSCIPHHAAMMRVLHADTE